YTIDIDSVRDLHRAEELLRQPDLPAVTPGARKRGLPAKVRLVVMDFDGVLTDNRVWVDEDGHESIAAYRSDSMGLNYLRRGGIDAVVLSTEVNPVVAARCKKMNVPVVQGVWDKAPALQQMLAERQLNPAEVIYIGNDINDVPCFPLVGCAVAVADAQPVALRAADLVLTRSGGHGAVRELCDLLLERLAEERKSA
ncbi:MAG: HAD hydrolase family protein, partial [Anaerolineaceae bacterium]